MSTKHLKKLLDQKEKEMGKVHESTEEEEVDNSQGKKMNRFALLNEGGNGSSGKEEEEDHTIQNGGEGKKKRKKKKGKKDKNKKELHEDLDAMAECVNEEGQLEDCLAIDVKDMFKFDPKCIDPSAELRKTLGKAFRLEGRSQENERRTMKRSARYVVTKQGWPIYKKVGLSMQQVKEEKGVNWFRFIHSNDYRVAERACKMAESIHNIDMVTEVLHVNPYHIDSLLIISNMLRMQEDVSQSQDLIERALYACEMSFHALFHASDWNHRLDYNQYENRSFFLVLHRHILNCDIRRSYNTAFNFGRLLFSIDPYGDPLGTVLILDSLALKSKQFQWVLQAHQTMQKWKNLDLLPNWAFSVALASFHMGKGDADELLLKAITLCPSIVASLVDELQLQLDNEMAASYALTPGALAREPETVRLLAKLFASLNGVLWKNASVLEWLERVVRSIGREYGTREEDNKARAQRAKWFPTTAPPIARALFLCNIPTTESTSLTDPFPPKNGKADYSLEIEEARMADESFVLGLLHSLYPDFNQEETLGQGVQRMMGNAVQWARGMMARDEEGEREDNQDA